MTYQELNQYILHYLTEDKTKSAIMLTGPWGTGNSYYIQNELKPFLEKKENGGHSCVIVSLYGLKDTAEISKSIYLGTRMKFLTAASEKSTTVTFAGETIIKGIAGAFGVDLSVSERSLKRLYASVNLTGKLVVLEDLERSGIDILEVLGYVNNLVEQDGVKVLLVANEEELIQYTPLKVSTKADLERTEMLDRLNGHKGRLFTDGTLAYLKVKEKTISDTIEFEEDYITAIREIVQIFDNETLNKFSTAENVKDILDIMSHCQSYNLRSFIFACQKTSDIFERLDEKYLSDESFIQAVFVGVLSFVLKQKNGRTQSWGKEKYFSSILGYEKAPLFKFCYNYITRQVTEFEGIEGAYQAYSELVLYDKNRSNNDNDIITLQTYYVRTDSDVLDAINNIERRLEVPEDISFYQYGTIAVYAIIIKGILGCDIDTIKRRLVANLEGQGNKLELEQIFRTIIGTDCTTKQIEEYELLRKEMARSLKKGDKIIPNFDYQPEQSKDFYDYAITNEGKFHTQESFAAQFDMKRLSEMFRNSTAEQKQQIRGVFVGMYRIGNIKSFLANDRESIVQLLEFIKADRSGDVGDRIQQLQYDWFIKNLEEIKRKLS